MILVSFVIFFIKKMYVVTPHWNHLMGQFKKGHNLGVQCSILKTGVTAMTFLFCFFFFFFVFLFLML